MGSTIVSRVSDRFSETVMWQDFAYAIVESPVEVRFLDLAKQALTPEVYDAGILFGKHAELQWRRRRSGLFHTVLIHDNGKEGESIEAEGEAESLERIVLWGEPQVGADPPAWYEPRIPKLITDYPAEFKGKRLAVSLRSYRLVVDVPRPRGAGSRTKPMTLRRCVGLTEAALEE